MRAQKARPQGCSGESASAGARMAPRLPAAECATPPALARLRHRTGLRVRAIEPTNHDQPAGLAVAVTARRAPLRCHGASPPNHQSHQQEATDPQ